MARARLRPGDTVGVVAPGFAVDRGALRRGLAALDGRGHRVVVGKHVRSARGYLAGDDDARAEDLARMLSDPEIDALWFARGGYGVTRILDRVPWRTLARRPRLLIGYSDLTALFNPAVDRAKATCLYAPVVTELGDPGAFDPRSLDAALAGRPAPIRFGRRQVLAAGRGRGRLVGGNLTVLTHLWGTPYQPRTDRRVLFLEDVGERLYAIDRNLTQLRSAGAFRRLAGVLIGGLDVTPRTRFPRDRRLLDVLRENFADLGIPVVRGLRVGHLRRKLTLPLGATAILDTRRGRVEFAP